MKTIRLLPLFLLAAAALSAEAEKTAAGPKGGRLLATEPHAAEFFVTAARTVEITFYDAAKQPVSPGPQVVTVTAEPAAGRVAVALERTATGFVSTAALPAGEPYRVVVQVRATADAKPKNFRIDFSLAHCAECKHAEYACTCASH
jgi:hypothetical protein